MKKVFLGEIVSIMSPGSLFQRLRVCRPKSPAIGFKIAMIIEALRPAMEAHAQQKAVLLQEHGTPVPGKDDTFHFRKSDDQGADVDHERWGAFKADYDELLSSEVEVQFTGLTLDDLEAANVEPPLSPDEIVRLLWLIDEPQAGENTDGKQSRSRKRKADD